MKAFVVTEGGKNIGFGHIARCTAIYQAFEEINILPEFVVNGDDSISGMLKGTRFKLFDWLKEKERLFEVLSDAEIVIVDSYLADVSFYKYISSKTKVPVYIDDNKRLEYPEGVIINGTVYAEEFGYPQRKGNDYLLGTKYTPLRKLFWEVPEKGISREMNNVMIMLGGYDPKNLTPGILNMLKREYPELVKNVVVGEGYADIEKIKLSADKKTNLIFNPVLKKFRDAVINADVAISAAGQSLYEFARAGIPVISVTVADNQINNVKGWKKAGFLEDAGRFDDSGLLKNISLGLRKLQDRAIRTERSAAGMAMIDGKGALRIAGYCARRCCEGKLSLRKAEDGDMLNVYGLSNDPAVRKNSFSPGKIEMKDHKSWFTGKLNDKNCLFLIAEIAGEFAGQIRFDMKENEAVISISTKKEYRGFGLGEIILKMSVGVLKEIKPEILNIRAFVKEENTGSSRLFEKSGFKLIETTKKNEHKSLEYLYRRVRD